MEVCIEQEDVLPEGSPDSTQQNKEDAVNTDLAHEETADKEEGTGKKEGIEASGKYATPVRKTKAEEPKQSPQEGMTSDPIPGHSQLRDLENDMEMQVDPNDLFKQNHGEQNAIREDTDISMIQGATKDRVQDILGMIENEEEWCRIAAGKWNEATAAQQTETLSPAEVDSWLAIYDDITIGKESDKPIIAEAVKNHKPESMRHVKEEELTNLGKECTHIKIWKKICKQEWKRAEEEKRGIRMERVPFLRQEYEAEKKRMLEEYEAKKASDRKKKEEEEAERNERKLEEDKKRRKEENDEILRQLEEYRKENVEYDGLWQKLVKRFRAETVEDDKVATEEQVSVLKLSYHAKMIREKIKEAGKDKQEKEIWDKLDKEFREEEKAYGDRTGEYRVVGMERLEKMKEDYRERVKEKKQNIKDARAEVLLERTAKEEHVEKGFPFMMLGEAAWYCRVGPKVKMDSTQEDIRSLLIEKGLVDKGSSFHGDTLGTCDMKEGRDEITMRIFLDQGHLWLEVQKLMRHWAEGGGNVCETRDDEGKLVTEGEDGFCRGLWMDMSENIWNWIDQISSTLIEERERMVEETLRNSEVYKKIGELKRAWKRKGNWTQKQEKAWEQIKKCALPGEKPYNELSEEEQAQRRMERAEVMWPGNIPESGTDEEMDAYAPTESEDSDIGANAGSIRKFRNKTTGELKVRELRPKLNPEDADEFYSEDGESTAEDHSGDWIKITKEGRPQDPTEDGGDAPEIPTMTGWSDARKRKWAESLHGWNVVARVKNCNSWGSHHGSAWLTMPGDMADMFVPKAEFRNDSWSLSENEVRGALVLTTINKQDNGKVGGMQAYVIPRGKDGNERTRTGWYGKNVEDPEYRKSMNLAYGNEAAPPGLVVGSGTLVPTEDLYKMFRENRELTTSVQALETTAMIYAPMDHWEDIRGVAKSKTISRTISQRASREVTKLMTDEVKQEMEAHHHDASERVWQLREKQFGAQQMGHRKRTLENCILSLRDKKIKKLDWPKLDLSRRKNEKTDGKDENPKFQVKVNVSPAAEKESPNKPEEEPEEPDDGKFFFRCHGSGLFMLTNKKWEQATTSWNNARGFCETLLPSLGLGFARVRDKDETRVECVHEFTGTSYEVVIYPSINTGKLQIISAVHGKQWACMTEDIEKVFESWANAWNNRTIIPLPKIHGPFAKDPQERHNTDLKPRQILFDAATNPVQNPRMQPPALLSSQLGGDGSIDGGRSQEIRKVFNTDDLRRRDAKDTGRKTRTDERTGGRRIGKERSRSNRTRTRDGDRDRAREKSSNRNMNRRGHRSRSRDRRRESSRENRRDSGTARSSWQSDKRGDRHDHGPRMDMDPRYRFPYFGPQNVGTGVSGKGSTKGKGKGKGKGTWNGPKGGGWYGGY